MLMIMVQISSVHVIVLVTFLFEEGRILFRPTARQEQRQYSKPGELPVASDDEDLPSHGNLAVGSVCTSPEM